jgi:hypothetical protein
LENIAGRRLGLSVRAAATDALDDLDEFVVV